mmetsp:Transcript_28204/g.65509  ORF Transcript_28204/g.65509 Transcript_28204/m.65509 type:complete len:214 (+) Transcript_28204:303-944(+)
MAKQTADNSRTNDMGLNVSAVGLNTMRQPKKPAKLAIHRSLPTFSPKKILAKVILKKGMVLLTTTQDAKSISVRPKHHKAIPAANKAPRNPCIHTRLVLNALRPWISMIGKRVTAADTNRRNTIWKGAIPLPRNFISPSFPMPMTKCIRYQAMPVKYSWEAVGDDAEDSEEAAAADSATAAATAPLWPNVLLKPPAESKDASGRRSVLVGCTS